MEIFVPSDYDTDLFGTFTGENLRELDPLETVRSKCQRAMEKYGYEIGIASEGSFGPHPLHFFLRADEEYLIFIDKKNKLEIFEREISTETNFDRAHITSEKHLMEFADKVYFPDHALILSDSENNPRRIIKGICDEESLITHFREFFRDFGCAHVQTDMRAMFNPTRMKVISRLARKLISKINSFCPSCGTPGFGLAEIKKGLKCRLCNSPTRSVISHISKCTKCDFKDEIIFPDGKEMEEPMFCDFCNP